MSRHRLATPMIPVLLLLGSMVTAAASQEEGAPKVRTRLVASTGTPGTDQPLRLGVRFEIKPGWHIYWRNPGGAGMATEIRWRVPQGVSAGETQWPLPIAFVQSGDIPGYGYEDTVVLAAELGGEAPLASNAVVGAAVSWLACKDVCVLGSAELEARWSELKEDPVFSRWDSALPAPWTDSEGPFSVSLTGGLSDGAVTLWLRWHQSPAPVAWFPDPPDGLVVEDVTIRTRGGLSRIDATVRKMAGAAGVFDSLPSVVVVTDDQQKRRGWSLAVDLADDNS